ncbi:MULTISPECIES: DUF2064 domain-containing protein [unclassified Aeromicrobium]|jgi:glycosyltransferase A (GT-A) superfamily protein (DUF2064 family)|uniref:TIGR04282 family arsenosugar biosynthesis glycosyltransferase n=1 Tax=unclassified Aeromicrobium TaxID=2633570 RepID=UPI000A526466|nr:MULTISPECIES: DUF2064 domain-containing protein [unclassified Aeromicrobium]
MTPAPLEPPSTGPVLLVVAKAPVPGLAKTRLGRVVGPDAAADVAAAALLDTLDAVQAARAVTGWPVVVAMTGEVASAARADDVRAALERTIVVPQRGDDFGERLAHAHADAGVHGRGTVQIGMDTPQVAPDDLVAAGNAVVEGRQVLGPADDGGWWLLGLPDPRRADALRGVPMSRDDTGELTRAALGDVELLRALCDVDEWPDAQSVASDLPGSRFARAVDRSTTAGAGA